MKTVLPNPITRTIQDALDWDVIPGLSAHIGSIEIVSADEHHAHLQFTGSCNSCYFRISCARNLVEPVVREVLGEDAEISIQGVGGMRRSPQPST
jgi:Fe-S cluster biogenesis protein NfuA